MVVSCCAWNCNEKFLKGSKITFHSFPVDEKRRKLWTLCLRRKDFVPSNYSKVCSKHFAEECFDREKFGGHWLKPTAVPTIFDYPKHLLPKDLSISSPKKQDIEDKVGLKIDSASIVATTTTVEPRNSTPQRYGKKYRYIGDFTEKDMDSPSKAKKLLQIAIDSDKKNRQSMKKLQIRLQRLKKKVTFLQLVVNELKKNSFISESGGNI